MADNLLGNDMLSPQDPQTLQENSQRHDRRENDGVHENAAFYDEINHDASEKTTSSITVTTQVDRLKVEDFKAQIMHDHTKLRAFELADEVVVLVYISHLGFLHSEMIKILQPSVFNLTT
jgi:hypothetical protein